MVRRLACPDCGRPLYVADEAPAGTLTCPRCLASVSVPPPDGTPTEERNITPFRPVVPPVPPPEAVRTAWPGANVDRDVRRDNQGVGAGLGCLAVLGAIGITIAVLVAASEGGPSSVFGLVAVLFVIMLLGYVIVVSTQGSGKKEPGWGRVIVTTLALAGSIVTVLLAVAVFAFVVCIASLSSGGLRLH